MLRKSKKGGLASQKEDSSGLASSIAFLQKKVGSAMAVASPDLAKALMEELVEKSREEGSVTQMVQAAKVMSEYMKMALQAQVQLLDVQRKMGNQTPENQVNVQINSGGVANVDEAHEELNRYLAIYGSEDNGRLSSGGKNGSSPVGGEAPEDLGGGEDSNGRGSGTPYEPVSDETEDNPFEDERGPGDNLPSFEAVPGAGEAGKATDPQSS